LRAAYLWRRHTFTTLLRNNLKTSDNRGTIELTWSRPLSGVLRLYAQYYYGYGESLLDHNWKVNRVGFGVAVSDYLQR
jgi:phospholipase A1